MTAKPSVVHRRTFQNANQVVELTIRTIPKTLPHTTACHIPPRTTTRLCHANNAPETAARVKAVGGQGDVKAKRSQVTVEVRQKKGHDKRREVQEQNVSSSSSCSSSSSSSVSRKRKEERVIEKYVMHASPPPSPSPPLSLSLSPPHSPPPSSSLPPVSHIPHHSNALQSSSSPPSPPPPPPPPPPHPNNASQPNHSSQRTSLPALLPPAPPRPPAPAPATAASLPPTTPSLSHPQQRQGNARLLSDDTTPSPFGRSAVVYLRHLKELLEARGLGEGEEGALVGVLEAYITGQGSNGGVGEGPSPATTTANTATTTPRNTSEGSAPSPPPLPPSECVREVERLRVVVAEQERVIGDLKRLSSHLILQLEQMVAKKAERDREERETATDGQEEEEVEKERLKRRTAKEEEEEERKRMKQENRKMREKIVNLEIQLTRTSRLLEIERQNNNNNNNNNKNNNKITTPRPTHPVITPQAHTQPQLQSFLPTQSHTTHTHSDQSGHTNHTQPHIDQSQSSTHTLPIPVTHSTPPQKLHKPQKLHIHSHNSESEADSAYEKTGSHLTSKTSSPPLSAVRQGEAPLRDTVGGVVGSGRAALEGSAEVLEKQEGNDISQEGGGGGGDKSSMGGRKDSRSGKDAGIRRKGWSSSSSAGSERGSRSDRVRGRNSERKKESEVLVGGKESYKGESESRCVGRSVLRSKEEEEEREELKKTGASEISLFKKSEYLSDSGKDDCSATTQPLPHHTTYTNQPLPHSTTLSHQPLPHTTQHHTTISQQPLPHTTIHHHTTLSHQPLPHTTTMSHQPLPHTTQHRHTHTSDTSSSSQSNRRRRSKKVTRNPNFLEVKLNDPMQRWVSQDTIDLSSVSTLDDDLINTRSTQESSFFQGILSARQAPVNTSHSSSQPRHSGTPIMESTRVPGSGGNGKTDSSFAAIEAGTPSLEMLRNSVDLLE